MTKGYSLSLDVSTTNVGIALWNEDGDLVELKHLELKIDKSIPNEDRYIHKASLFKNYLKDFRDRIKEDYDAIIENLFIEAPLNNTPKNINTTALLLGFNGIACYSSYEVFNIIPKKITVHESRKIFCPEFVNLKKRKGEMVEVLSFPKGWKNDQKKEYIRKKVAELEPHIEWFLTRNNTINPKSYDMSDAYCVGYAGLKVLELI